MTSKKPYERKPEPLPERTHQTLETPTVRKPVNRDNDIYLSNGRVVISSFSLALGSNIKHAKIMKYIDSLNLGKTRKSIYFIPVEMHTPGSDSFRAYYITRGGFELLDENIFRHPEIKQEYLDAIDKAVRTRADESQTRIKFDF